MIAALSLYKLWFRITSKEEESSKNRQMIIIKRSWSRLLHLMIAWHSLDTAILETMKNQNITKLKSEVVDL